MNFIQGLKIKANKYVGLNLLNKILNLDIRTKQLVRVHQNNCVADWYTNGRRIPALSATKLWNVFLISNK